MKTSHDIYAQVTDQIIQDLENGVRPWQKPWNSGSSSLPLRSNGIPYQGINTLILWLQSDKQNYTSSTWMTFKQAKTHGGSVRKGQKGTKIVYASTFTKADTDQNGEETERKIPYLKTYSVFNIDQIDNLKEEYYNPLEEVFSPKDRIALCEAFFKATGATIQHGGDRAYYSVHQDYIQMPLFESFHSSESYYGTLAHESVHWTGSKARLDREFISFRKDPEKYGFEELIAELGAAFLCARLGLEPEVREDHSSYIATWLKCLKDNDRAIFKATSQAQKAVEFLYELDYVES